MRRALSLMSGLLLLLLCVWPAGVHAQDKPTAIYTVAIVPVVPPSEIKRRWQPLLDRLNQDSGLHFRFRFYKDFQSFEKGLAQGEPDFAVMSPLQTWRMRQHYLPALRGNVAMNGIVVVHKDSPIRQLADLHERTLSLPDGGNHAANLLVLQGLKEQKIMPDLRPVKTENNAVRSVLLGKADAAIINNYTLKFVPDGLSVQLRIIHQTVDLPPPPISASLRLRPEVVAQMKAAMLRLQEREPQLLQSIMMPVIVEADLERDYSIMGKLLPLEADNGSY